MDALFGLTQTLVRFADSLGQLLLVAAMALAALGLVVAPHLRTAALATAFGLAALHYLH